jgi:hypothetical protein
MYSMNGESAFEEDLEAFDESIDSADYDFDDDESADYDFDDDESAEYDDFDDDAAAEYDDFDDDASEYDYDDDESAEFLPIPGMGLPFLAKGLGKAIGGVGRLLSRPRRRARRIRPYIPRVRRPSTAISGISNLFGQLRTTSGRSIPFRLPKNIATKKDIAVLRRAIRTNTTNSLKNSRGVKKNISAITRNAKRVTAVDKKHTTASKAQNRILTSLNRRMRRVQKNLDETKQQAQMQMLFSLMMQPELSSITVEPDSNSTNAFDPISGEGVLTVTASDSGDDDNLGLLLALSGGFGDSKGGMNPLMLLLLTDSI